MMKRRYFCTGATGFIGREIVRQLIAMEDTEEIVLLTRDAQKRYEMLSWSKKIRLYEGDITETTFPESEFTDLIHGANEANDLLQPDKPRYYYTIVEGTDRIMDWAASHISTNGGRVLLLSSGAAARDTLYGRAKRQCERIMWDSMLTYSVARLYAVVGEEMPLGGQYAAGIFVKQAMKEGKVRYYGGTSERAYLHVEDAAHWLLEILDRGSHRRTYDVAGDASVPIYLLAYLVAEVFGVPCEKVDGPDRKDVYVPDSLQYAKDMGLKQTIPLKKAIERIRNHLKNEPSSDLRHTHLEAA